MDDGYRTQSPDTDPAVERRQFAIWRAMTPAQKLRLVHEQNRLAERLARAGIRMRHPDATDREIFLRLAALRLGRDTVLRIYGWDPEVQGW